ncbi:MAG: Smr/MutS family protein [Gemmatimonadales bacterium]
MPREKPKLTALWRALDEAAFGPERTLNLRESLPSAADARARAEVWLRARQMTRAKEVLVITGRGNQSVGGIGVIRKEILNMLPSLRRRGIVENWKEHSPGSIVVQIAPMSALLDAPRRRRNNGSHDPVSPGSPGLEGLQPETISVLRQLARQNLELLGITDSEAFLKKEMQRTFSAIMSGIPESGDRERGLFDAIHKAIDEVSD